MNIIDRFSDHLKDILTKAMVLATEMKNKNVEPIHLFFALSNAKGSLANEIIGRFKIDSKIIEQLLLGIPIVKEDINKKNLPKTLELTPYSNHCKKIIERAILLAHTYKHNYVGSEHLLSAIINLPNAPLQELFKLNHLNLEELDRQVKIVLENSTHFPLAAEAGKAMDKMQQNLPDDLFGSLLSGMQSAMPGNKSNQNNSALDVFANHLTGAEMQTNLDPVIGREQEIERLIQILSRRTKNNPILIGDPGVGKTAIVEGLAKKIYNNDVPEILLNKKIYALDMGILIAGTTFRGEFEGRLQQVIEEVSSNPNIILFIDEIHNIVGAGSNQGTMDAANILKPALSRGLIRCIGATTPAEFKKYIENDAALERRFQPIIVKQSSVDDTIKILQGLKKNYEIFHNVTITDEAILAAAILSERYLNGKLLPDKAIDLIDETAAGKKLRSKIGIEQKRLLIKHKELETIILDKEKAAMNDNFKQAVIFKQAEENIKKEITQLLRELEHKKIKPIGTICKHDVVAQLAKIVGTPIDDLLLEGKQKFQQFKTNLLAKIIGQDKVISEITEIIQQAQLCLSNPNRPLASLMFVGESGVGKTATAMIISKLLYPNDESLIKLDMSEFNESFGVSKLLGSPAGYVGYKEQNRFTDKLKLNPYCVLLLDEIDKAHKDVTKLLLQMLESGEITDSQNRKVSLKHAIIIMTTTIGSEMAKKQEIGFAKSKNNPEKISRLVEEKLKEYFSPEIINRLDKICVFNNLNKSDLSQIAKLEVEELNEQLKNYQTKIDGDLKTLQKITDKLPDHNLNARYVRNHLRKELEKLISEKIVTDNLKTSFRIMVSDDKIVIR